MSETINLSDGDIKAMQNGEKVGPWILDLNGSNLNVYVKIDDGEPSQKTSTEVEDGT